MIKYNVNDDYKMIRYCLYDFLGVLLYGELFIVY